MAQIRKEDILTKGDVLVNKIKIGDIHYEYELGMGIKSIVVTLPILGEDGVWRWKSKNMKTGRSISYAVNPKYSHYGPNLYTYEAYSVTRYI